MPKPTLSQALAVATVAFTAIAFTYSVFHQPRGDLLIHVKRGAAGGSVPTALVLIYGAIDRRVLTQISGLNVPIAIAGLIWLFLAVYSTRQHLYLRCSR